MRQIESQPQGVIQLHDLVCMFQLSEPVCRHCAELRQPLGGERTTLLCVSLRIQAEAGFCSWKKHREWMNGRYRARAGSRSLVVSPASNCRIVDHVARHDHGRSKRFLLILHDVVWQDEVDVSSLPREMPSAAADSHTAPCSVSRPSFPLQTRFLLPDEPTRRRSMDPSLNALWAHRDSS